MTMTRLLDQGLLLLITDSEAFGASICQGDASVGGAKAAHKDEHAIFWDRLRVRPEASSARPPRFQFDANANPCAVAHESIATYFHEHNHCVCTINIVKTGVSTSGGWDVSWWKELNRAYTSACGVKWWADNPGSAKGALIPSSGCGSLGTATGDPETARATRESEEYFGSDEQSSQAIEVRDFCEEKQIGDEVEKALNLAKKHFGVIGKPEFEVVYDPDHDEHYLGIHISVFDHPRNVVQKGRTFARDLRNSVDRGKLNFINVIYHAI